MKTYVAYWSTDFDNAGLHIHPSGFFCEEHCYSPEDVAAIHALEVGQTWEDPDYGIYHTVIRIS